MRGSDPGMKLSGADSRLDKDGVIVDDCGLSASSLPLLMTLLCFTIQFANRRSSSPTFNEGEFTA